MKSLGRSLSASIFSLGKCGYSGIERALPPDALVIVIQDKSEALPFPPALPRPDGHHGACESLPAIRRKAKKAYSEHSQARIPMSYLSG